MQLLARRFGPAAGTSDPGGRAWGRLDDQAPPLFRLSERQACLSPFPTLDASTARRFSALSYAYLWAESTDLEKLAAEGGDDWPSEAALASLFRDLGVAGLDATPGPATMADRAPAQHEARMNAATPASPESERDRCYSRAFMDLEPKIRDLV